MPSDLAREMANSKQEFEVFVLNQLLDVLKDGTNPEPITGAIADEYARALDAVQCAPEEGKIHKLEAELAELEGCREQSIIRGDRAIGLEREVVNLRADLASAREALRMLQITVAEMRRVAGFQCLGGFCNAGKVLDAILADPAVRAAVGEKP